MSKRQTQDNLVRLETLAAEESLHKHYSSMRRIPEEMDKITRNKRYAYAGFLFCALAPVAVALLDRWLTH